MYPLEENKPAANAKRIKDTLVGSLGVIFEGKNKQKVNPCCIISGWKACRRG